MTQNMQVVESGPISPEEPIINDFAMTFCTVNGSGSATANLTVMRAIFKMGIPVSGKNIFPSNIQGLPTWYTIRVNKDGFVARVEKDDMIIAMNPATFIRDLDYLVPGGVVFYSDDIKTPPTRDDLIYYPMPVKKLVRNTDAPPQLRDFIMNMVYVGVVAQVLGIDLGAVRQSLEYHFKGKKTPVESNFAVIKGSFEWAAENIVKKDPYRIAPMEATKGDILSDGNTAAALGAIFGGVQFVSWYPITPASSLPEALNEYLPVFRTKKETGEQTFAIVQAEDEIAAAGMLVGAGWAGLRAMTATSGPGLSLMTENIGLAYFAEVPLVIWDVQRIGPSTGMPTRTSQGDITEVYFMSHGDTNIIQLFPSSVNECFDFGWWAFDIAERIQTPVVVMSDLDLGMNQWMGKPFDYPDRPMDRGKLLWEVDLDKIINEDHKTWGRYLDVDGDGIPYRTVPGNQNPKSAYFTRGTGHDEYAFYSEDADVWERLITRLGKKYETAKEYIPRPIVSNMEGAHFGIISYGSTEMAVEETRAKLKQEGIATDYLRIRALPATEEIEEFIRSHDRVYVVEINRDGQMRQILTLNFPALALKLYKVARSNGMPLSARWVRETILGYETPIAHEEG